MSGSGVFAGHVARKRFGQNFLRDQAVIGRIVQIIDPRPGQSLLEIGPGQGALTWPLLQALGKMRAIELDRDLAAGLRRSAVQHGDLELIEADALKVDLTALAGTERLRVVGNFPYNISSPLLFHLLDHLAVIDDIHCMLQAEVVARMASGPGGREYGRLSVMLQSRCAIESVLDVPASAFQPVPKVQSAIARLRPLAVQPTAAVLEQLELIVRAAFAQRRKTLTNSLRKVVSTSRLTELGIDPGERAEQVSVAAFLRLAELAAAEARA